MNKFQVVIFSLVLAVVSTCVYSQTITCSYDNKTLGNIITSICTSANKTCSINADVPVNVIVSTCNVIDTPFEIVLKKILRDNNCMFELKDNCYYIKKIASKKSDNIVTPPIQEFSSPVKELDYGMSQEDVVAILGKPDSVMFGEYMGSEIYRYPGVIIIFKKRKITGFDKPAEAVRIGDYFTEKARDTDMIERSNAIRDEINRANIARFTVRNAYRNPPQPVDSGVRNPIIVSPRQ